MLKVFESIRRNANVRNRKYLPKYDGRNTTYCMAFAAGHDAMMTLAIEFGVRAKGVARFAYVSHGRATTTAVLPRALGDFKTMRNRFDNFHGRKKLSPSPGSSCMIHVHRHGACEYLLTRNIIMKGKCFY